MPNLLEKVKSIINETDSLPFIYNEITRANNEVDTSVLPCVVAYRNPKSKWHNNFGNYCEECDWLLFIVDKTDFDRTAFENEEIITDMKNLGISLVRNFRKSSDVEIIKYGVNEYNTQKVYEQFDITTTGVALMITLRETKGVCK